MSYSIRFRHESGFEIENLIEYIDHGKQNKSEDADDFGVREVIKKTKSKSTGVIVNTWK